MIDISVHSLEKFFGDFQLLKDITFDIYEGEKVGLIGKNGAGKTTLMKILTSLNTVTDTNGLFDAGEVHINKSKQVGLIDQIPIYPSEYTVDDVLKTAFNHLYELRDRISELESLMQTDSSGKLLKEYGNLLSRFEHEGGYNIDYELEMIANGLELDHDMRERKFYMLSGGEQTRVNLARIILQKTEILLLDEPTNHLDIDSVEWLGEYLETYKGTVMLISHDRYFLDQVCSRIIEIEDGVSSDYSGNYSFYMVEKERRYNEALKLWESQTKEKERLEEMARRYRSWATEKMIKRALVIEHKIERMTIADRPRKERSMKVKLGEASFEADEALKLKSLSKSFGSRKIIDDISLMIRGGERVSIYGPNGCGKTTLIKMITGDLQPDAGMCRFGLQIKWAYLPQIVEFEHPDRTVLDEIIYTLPLSTQAARDRLAAYKFVGEDVFKPISALSGGERSRLKLCILMHDDLNFLILDEPTNHLDLSSRECIEEVLDGFSGVILFVSHDRYFVSRFATRVWELANGKIFDFRGDFEAYRAYKKRAAMNAPAKQSKDVESAPTASKLHMSEQKAMRIAAKQRDAMEREVAKLEKEISEIDAETEKFSADYEKLSELLDEKASKEERLLELYEKLDI